MKIIDIMEVKKIKAAYQDGFFKFKVGVLLYLVEQHHLKRQ